MQHIRFCLPYYPNRCVDSVFLISPMNLSQRDNQKHFMWSTNGRAANITQACKYKAGSQQNYLYEYNHFLSVRTLCSGVAVAKV